MAVNLHRAAGVSYGMSRVLFVLLIAHTLHAQSIFDQEAARARALLTSQNWPEKAWGVYLAGRLHSEEFRAPLAEQIRAAASQSATTFPSEPNPYVSALLDAAIELQLAIPAADIEPFLTRWSTEALVLLSRAPDNEQALLRLGDSNEFSLPWLAANNLLFEMKSSAWYRRLLGEITITHHFYVTDPMHGAGGFRGGGIVCGVGAAWLPRLPKGFPPIARYTISRNTSTGSTVLAPGPHPVYYTREFLAENRPPSSGSGSEYLEPQIVREDHLAALSLLQQGDIRSRLHIQSNIHFTAPEQFRHDIEQHLAQQEAQLRDLFHAIDRTGMHTPPGLMLRITVEIDDSRSDKSVPLPAVPSRDIAFN
jgi:hypothetical protein